MKKTCLYIFLLLIYFPVIRGFSQNEPFTKRVVSSGFNSAWEVVYGPNDSLWITENKTYRIQRVSIANGTKTQLLDIKTTDAAINLPSSGSQAQGGLMGLAIHPALYSSNAAVRHAQPWIYAVYVYKRGSCPGTQTSCVFTTKIVRYTYSGNALVNPQIILDNIPGSNDHNSGRLIIGPSVEPGADVLHTQYRLYYTVGDMGAGRALNTTRTQNALNTDVLEGKVLRINTSNDGDAGADAWIPNDNPFYNSSAITGKDYVYSYGHRNPQGLAWGTVGASHILYSSEQMDKTDDEVNIIRAGRSYGWDSVAGYCDGNVNGTRIGQTASANEQQYCSRNPNHTEPIFTLFTATAAEVAAMPANNALWPTVACSSIDFYGGNKIPGWNYSLLVSPLKEDYVFRLSLNASGTAVTGDTISYFRGDGNRIRRVTVAPDGVKFYVARDVGASANGGTVMEYIYSNAVLAIGNHPRTRWAPDNNDILIYPNPALNTITVRLPKHTPKPIRAYLFNLAGSLIREQRSTQATFSVSMHSLPPGVYTLKIYNGYDATLKVKKIIKH